MKKTKVINALSFISYGNAFSLYTKGIFVLLLFLLSQSLSAQHFEDSIKYSLKQKPKPVLKLDSKNAFVTNLSVRTIGVKVGIEFNKTLQFGIGYNWLNTSIKHDFISQHSITDTIAGYLKYQYLSPFLNYTFYKSKKWVFSIPVQLGIGKAYYEYSTLSNKKNKLNEAVILTYEPAITVEYKPIKYIGIGPGIGYRFAFYNELRKQETFTAPVWTVISRVYFGELYRDIFPKKKTGSSNEFDEPVKN